MNLPNVVFILFIVLTSFGCQSNVGNLNSDQDVAGQFDDNKTGQRTTLEGEIVAVEYYDAGNCSTGGIHIQLKTSTAVMPVHLGPIWYVNMQASRLTVGEPAVVNGMLTQLNGQPAVIAIEIITGRGTLKLRDQNGSPYWRGHRRNMKQTGPSCPMYMGW